LTAFDGRLEVEQIRVEIDGTECTGPKGSTILDIAKANDIYIPTLCYDPRMQPYGACRLCLVEVEGARGLLPACYAEATDGMVVKTTTETLERIRKTLVELLLSDHEMECQGCTQSGRCELQELANRYGITESPFVGEKHEYVEHVENPFVMRDYNKCIMCGRCIRICREVQGVGVYDFVNRGFKAIPGTPFDKDMQETPCEFCGQCISTCPTGAIKARPYEGKGRIAARDMLRNACAYFKMSEEDMMEALGLDNWVVRTTCAYCGCGCQLDLHVIDNKVAEVTSPKMVGSGQGNHRERRAPDEAPDPQGQEAGRGRVGRGARPGRQEARRHQEERGGRRHRGLILRPGHERGQLPRSKVHTRGDRHEQRRPLRPVVTRSNCRRSGENVWVWSDDQHDRRPRESEGHPGHRF
jgi:predicted molibdopterin-dependent oxidoreductase YjgC